MEVETSGMCIDKTKGGIWKLIPNTTYRFNKTIATATIRFIVTVAIFVYKGLIPVVYRMLTFELSNFIRGDKDIKSQLILPFEYELVG